MIEDERFDLEVQVFLHTRSFALAARLRSEGATVLEEEGGLLRLAWTSPDPVRLLALSAEVESARLELRLVAYYDQFGWDAPPEWRALVLGFPGPVDLEVSAVLD